VANIAVKLQYQGFQTGYDIQYRFYVQPAEVIWPSAVGVMRIMNDIFLGIFTVDLAVRIAVLRVDFFANRFNWLDAFVVASSWFEVVFTLDINPFILRLLRLIKFGRALRVLRNPAMLESMNMLIRCVAACATTLFWSYLILLFFNCIGGMILSILSIGYMQDESVDVEKRRRVFKFFGTFGRTILTMFEVFFANWAPACRVLTENISEWFGLFFVVYRCLAGFAVLNVVNAVFIQQTMKVAQRDSELMINMKENQQKAYGKNLMRLFNELDSSGDGSISRDEFEALIKDQRLKTFFSALEIDPDDVEELWALIDDGDGLITAQEFVKGAMRMKGDAKGLDMVGLINKMKKVEKHIEVLIKSMHPYLSGKSPPSAGKSPPSAGKSPPSAKSLTSL